MAELSLARDFPPAQEADWQALVKEALKGAPISSLRSVSYDGIVIEPLYARAKDATVIPGREAGEAWGVMQRIDLPDANAANAPDPRRSEPCARAAPCSCSKARSAITAMPFPQRSCDRDGAKGRASRLGRPDRARFRSAVAAGRWHRRQLCEGEGAPPSAVNIRFGFDPLGAMATRGVVPKPWTELAPAVTALIAGFVEQGFTGPFCVADGRPSMPPEARRRRSLPSRSPMPSLISARSKRMACPLRMRAASSSSVLPPTRTSS